MINRDAVCEIRKFVDEFTHLHCLGNEAARELGPLTFRIVQREGLRQPRLDESSRQHRGTCDDCQSYRLSPFPHRPSDWYIPEISLPSSSSIRLTPAPKRPDNQAQNTPQTHREQCLTRKPPPKAQLRVMQRVPPQVAEIFHDDSGVHSLDSLKSSNEHIQSLPSDTSYASQQLASERAQDVEQEGQTFADEAAREARQFVSRVEQEAGLLGNEARSETRSFQQSSSGKKFEEVKDKVQSEYKEVRKEVRKEAGKAKEEAKKGEKWAEKNKGNPVVVGNAVVIAGLAGVLGFGAYRLSQNESLTWRVVGVWAGAVGLFAVGDYFVSSWLFKKYPPKN